MLIRATLAAERQRACANHCKQGSPRPLAKAGRIITIGSYFADRVPAPVVGVYAASKSALAAFTKALARELGPKEVTVNLVQPGSIDTDMNPAHGPVADTLRQFMA